MIQESYKSYVNKQTYEGLQAIILRMDKEKYPENYEFVRNRIEQLKNNTDFTQSKIKPVEVISKVKSNKASLVIRGVASLIDSLIVCLPFAIIIIFNIYRNDSSFFW